MASYLSSVSCETKYKLGDSRDKRVSLDDWPVEILVTNHHVKSILTESNNTVLFKSKSFRWERMTTDQVSKMRTYQKYDLPKMIRDGLKTSKQLTFVRISRSASSGYPLLALFKQFRERGCSGSVWVRVHIRGRLRYKDLPELTRYQRIKCSK